MWNNRVEWVVTSAVACSLVAACSSDPPIDPGFPPDDAAVDVFSAADSAPLAPVTLAVARVGQGTVTSLPSGIDCGATCGNAFPSGTTVVLKAVPTAGWEFAGWNGVPTCKGTGSCAITLGADTKVTATFFPTED